MILVGQSIVLGEVKAETPVHDEDPKLFDSSTFNKLNRFHQKTE